MRLSIVAITLAISLFVLPFNFTYSEVSADSNYLQLEIEAMFKARADIWNKFVLGGYETIELLERDLSVDAVDPLLKTDIFIFNEMKYNPTSYELIDDVQVESFTITSINDQTAVGNLELRWSMQDLHKKYVEHITYTVHLIRVNRKWMLSDYITQ